MNDALPTYEVHALRFASVSIPTRSAFLVPAPATGDPHESGQALDFYVWAIRGHGRTVVVDMGFDTDGCVQRRPVRQHDPARLLQAIGIDPATVPDVVVTHLHFDHAGNSAAFPAATFHLQDREMAYATGRYMRYRALNRATDLHNVLAMVAHVYAGRVEFHDGDATLAPGITLHRVGGHTDGLQVVRVHTARGWVVLASDAAHLWANVEQDNPFGIVQDVGRALEGHRLLRRLADSPDHLIPGHDPLVMARFPALAGFEGTVACLHLPPTAGGAAADGQRAT